MKTSELIDEGLDWAVAKALGILRSDKIQMFVGRPYAEGLLPNGYCPVAESAFDIPLHQINYSTDWSQGGPIIERERITLRFWDNEPYITAYMPLNGSDHSPWWHGPTPLIAAMRCFVASKLGDEVEIPDELK